jgi:23S rRNA (guanosine2251-2'-O)-methyltransferase
MNLIIGRKPVLEALNSGEKIDQVYILYGQQGAIINSIIVAAKKRGVKVNQVSSDKFKQITKDKIAQGVAAIKSFQKFYTLEELLNSARQKHKKTDVISNESSSEKSEFSNVEKIFPPISQSQNDNAVFPLLLILDSIQDTHNVGAIIRSAECSGVDGIIITKHNSAPINETVLKTSAGAAEHVKICPVSNLAQTLKELKENGYWIIGSSLDNSKPYTEVDYKMPVALIVGNEEKGIRKLTADNCDILVRIPMKGKIQSLNVSVAAGILLFEIQRQRSL